METDTHYLYEELRNLETFDARRTEIIKELLKSAKQIERPEGI